MSAIIDHTLFTFRIVGQGAVGLLLWGTVTTAIRFGALYALIRVAATAVAHGSF